MSGETVPGRMQIGRVQIHGYRALQQVDVPLGPLNVLIGPNGVGKSSFLDVFSLFAATLGRLESLTRSLSRRGGLGRILTQGRSNAVSVTFQTDALGLRPSVSALTYHVEIFASGIGHEVALESLSQARYKQGPAVLFSRNLIEARVYDAHLKRRRRLNLVMNEGELALAHVAGELKPAEWFRTAFGDVQYHGPIPTGADAAVRRPQTLEPTSLVPAPEGQNLFSVLYQLRHEEPEFYERVLDALRAAFRGFDRLEFPVVGGGQVTLAWYDGNYPGKPFFANELSAGTLRYLHLVTLLLSPRPPTMILLDEPEDSLHPVLLRLVAELLLEAAERTQLVVATQSDALLRWLRPEHIIVADVDDGACKLTPGSALDLERWLKEYTLAQLRDMGQLGGQP